jgi:tryptophan synthase beta chain
MVTNNQAKYGEFGGQYVPETLMTALKTLEEDYQYYINNDKFIETYKTLLKNYAGRPSHLYFAQKMTQALGGAKIYLKREDLNHTGSHKINNVIGRVLLAKKMGKKEIIAETGAGQHGVATATVASLMDLECTIYMGAVDIKRQKYNVDKMRLLGATIESVTSGSKTLKDATNAAIRQWVQNVDKTFYVIGSVVGPHPYPAMVKNFQKIIGEETKEQLLAVENQLPDKIIACIGGGSNAMGIFNEFIQHEAVDLIGVEAAGLGLNTAKHGSVFKERKKGVFHGMKTYLLQDSEGQIQEAYSISAGLDYPGIGPEHAYFDSIDRVSYKSITDQEAVDAYEFLARTEGIIPALESSHAIAYGMKLIPTLPKDQIVVINLSGRGDKDLDNIIQFKKGSDLHE